MVELECEAPERARAAVSEEVPAVRLVLGTDEMQGARPSGFETIRNRVRGLRGRDPCRTDQIVAFVWASLAYKP